MITKNNYSTLGWLIIIILIFILIGKMASRDPFIINTPAFEIIVVDNQTQKPLAGAKVEISWGEYAGGSCGGLANRSFRILTKTTDASGKILVPANKSTHFLTSFEAVDCEVSHPGYIRRYFGLFAKGINSEEPLRILNVSGAKFDGHIAYLRLDQINEK